MFCIVNIDCRDKAQSGQSLVLGTDGQSLQCSICMSDKISGNGFDIVNVIHVKHVPDILLLGTITVLGYFGYG